MRVDEKGGSAVEQRQEFSVHCRELLALPLLAESVVLAGGEGLDKMVRQINVMEVPDVTDWVRPGEFLMTTGYPFHNQPGAFLRLIRDLSAKGVVALGVKTKRFLNEIPREVIELANELQFPLIELPVQTVFSDVIREVMELVLSSELRQVAQLQLRMQSITDVLLAGGELSELLESVQAQVNNPVVLVDAKFGCSYSTMLRDWSAALDGMESLSAVALSSWTNGKQPFVLGSMHLELFVARTEQSHTRDCALILLPMRGPWNQLDALTVERTLPLMELEIMNVEARKSVEYKYIDQFLQDWLFGRLANRIDLRMRAEVCGYPLDESSHYIVALIYTRNRLPAVSFAQVQPELQRLRATLAAIDRADIHATYFDYHLILLIPATGEMKKSEFRQLAEHVLNPQQVLCVGKSVAPEQLQESFKEALAIEQISRECRLDKSVLLYDDLGLFPLLSVLPDVPEVARFKEKYMLPLLEFDESHHLNLVETLDAYFSCNQNMKLTAAKLFTHYNTIVYRMERIKRLLGFDLDQAETKLQLYLALKLLQLEKSRRSYD